MTKFFLMAVTSLLMLTSCQAVPVTATVPPTRLPAQPTLMPTTSATVAATLTVGPTETATPTPYLTPIPYPTAGTVQGNVVAFIAKDFQEREPDTLWIANVDGSGETKLIESIKDATGKPSHDSSLQWSPYGKWLSYTFPHTLWIVSSDGKVERKVFVRDQLSLGTVRNTWSPDGKWLSYALPTNGLWIVSPDSMAKRKLVSFPKLTSINGYSTFQFISSIWTKDSAKIAYGEWKQVNKQWMIIFGVVDIATGKTSEIALPSKDFHINLSSMSWSPNEQYLMLNASSSFLLIDVSTMKITKEIKIKTSPSSKDCDDAWYENRKWSPNWQVFHYTPSAILGNWICITWLNGSTELIARDDGLISNPVWDETGNFLYFVTRKTDFESHSHLIQYDVRTQQTKEILSIEGKPYRYTWQMTKSPDGRKLALQARTFLSGVLHRDFIILDLQSPAVTKWHIDLPVSIRWTGPAYQWTADSQNILFTFGENPEPNQWPQSVFSNFYRLNIQTGQTTVFSGKHLITQWTVSPVALLP